MTEKDDKNRPQDDTEAFVVPIEREIDLHTFRPKDIPFVVQDYLIEAREKGFREVRIVHGKGIGFQRDVVRKVLSATDFVERFADDFNGNKGATMVWLAVRDGPGKPAT